MAYARHVATIRHHHHHHHHHHHSQQLKTEQSLSLIWAEAGQQPQLQSALGVGDFDFPAVLTILPKKQLSVRLLGAVDERSFSAFFREYSTGQNTITLLFTQTGRQ